MNNKSLCLTAEGRKVQSLCMLYSNHELHEEESSRAQHSSKLLVAFASTVVVGFGPRRNPRPNWFKTNYVFGN
jgi:hypothetical protein